MRKKNATVIDLERSRSLANAAGHGEVKRRKTVRLQEEHAYAADEAKGSRSKYALFWNKQRNQVENYVKGKRYASGATIEPESTKTRTRNLSSSVALPNMPSKTSQLTISLQAQQFIDQLSVREKKALKL